LSRPIHVEAVIEGHHLIATERPVTERLFVLSLAGDGSMENGYWLGRKRASLKAAQDAVSAEARLIHYDLAGRYSLNALSVETRAIGLAHAFPPSICASGTSKFDRERSDA
jgi:hypothetical protein